MIAAHIPGDEVVEGMDILGNDGEWKHAVSVRHYATEEWPFFAVVTTKSEDHNGYSVDEEAFSAANILTVRYERGLVE